jgi:hypothetical protein
MVNTFDEAVQQLQGPGGGAQGANPQGKLQFLYQLAQMNPHRSDFANMYLDELMKSAYPEPKDPMQQYLDQMMGQLMGNPSGQQQVGAAAPTMGGYGANQYDALNTFLNGSQNASVNPQASNTAQTPTPTPTQPVNFTSEQLAHLANNGIDVPDGNTNNSNLFSNADNRYADLGKKYSNISKGGTF